MKKVLQPIATVILLCAIVFLAGEWPDSATRTHVVLCDTSALLIALVCGLYLKRSCKKETGRSGRP